MRSLKILVVAMGVLIVAGTVTLVALIVQRAGGAFQASVPVASGPARLTTGAGSPDGSVSVATA